jgi:hypothetical protein
VLVGKGAIFRVHVVQQCITCCITFRRRGHFQRRERVRGRE